MGAPLDLRPQSREVASAVAVVVRRVEHHARARGQTTHRSFALGLQQWQGSVRHDARTKAEGVHRAAHAGQENLQLLDAEPIIAVQQRLAQRGPRCLRNTGRWVRVLATARVPACHRVSQVSQEFRVSLVALECQVAR